MPPKYYGQVGARTWYNNNTVRWDGEELTRGDYYNNMDDCYQLQQAANLTAEALDQIGREAVERGCNLLDPKREVTFTGMGRKVEIFRSIGDGWNKIDGTMWKEDEDTRMRYGKQPRWERNSCAIDVVLMAAIQLDIGRVQIDQVGRADILHLNYAAYVLRQAVAEYKWGLCNDEERRAIRNLLMEKCVGVVDNYRYGRMCDVKDVLSALMTGFPQCSWTSCWNAKGCCDGAITIPVSRSASVVSMIDVTRSNGIVTLSEAINHIFRRQEPDSVSNRCETGQACTRDPVYSLLVLDRLPPTLILKLPETITLARNDEWKIFDPLTVHYQTSHRDVIAEARYRAVGAIYYGDQHFVLRWVKRDCEDGKPIRLFDGLGEATPTGCDDWFSDVDADTGVTVVFFRRIDV